MPIKSRAKGARREREACDLLEVYEIFARRSQQYKGTSDSPDIEGRDGETFFQSFPTEVKAREVFRLYPWLEKIKRENPDKGRCLVVYKKNHKPWTITMYAEDLLPVLYQYHLTTQEK